MRIVDYVTIAIGGNEDSLDEVVRLHISNGWQPLGGGFVATNTRTPIRQLDFCQTMVKYADYEVMSIDASTGQPRLDERKD